MDWQRGEAGMAGAVARNNVTVEGRSDGQPMLFAHGFGCSQDMWRRMVPAFSDDYRLVLFDHVGAGGSDVTAYDREKYSELDGYASDLLEVCDELRLEQVILVAHSVSAMIAVIAAVREPVRFWRLVLVAPSPCYIDDPESGYVGGFSREDIEGLLESVNSNYVGWAQAIAPLVMGNPQFPELTAELSRSFVSTVPQIAQEFARVTFMTDSRHLLEMVSTPALVLQCSEDALVPDSVGGYIHEHMGGSTLVKLEATGHCPHVSAPDETTAAVARYLEAAHPLPF
jgi:sigma-B regulation protein RsbQ